MPVDNELDLSAYHSLPRLDVPSGVATSIALLGVMPKPSTPAIRKSAKKLREAVVALQKNWAQRSPSPQSTVDPRSSDKRVDNAWSALRTRLLAASWLPDDSFPIANESKAILDRVFPEGLSFLTLPYPSEWAESQKRLQQIDGENLAGRIDAIAGSEYLKELRDAHQEYGKAVQALLTRQEHASTNLLEPLRTLLRAMAAYVRQVVALVDEDDPATIATVRTALRPIDAFRQMAARRSSDAPIPEDTPPEASPTSPVPDVN